MDSLILFQHRCEAIGSSATDEQVAQLVDWLVDHVPQALWGNASAVALDSGIDGLSADISMRMGESGL